MADLKISALTGASTPLAGTEVLPIVQSGSTVKVSVDNLTAGRAISATQITATTGNFIIGTAGQGIDFSINPSAPGMTSELLNDYEEGTWTPVLQFGGGSTGITYAQRSGRYTKIGRTVTINFYIELSSKGTSIGNASVQGLPFVDNNVISACPIMFLSGFAGAYNSGVCYSYGTALDSFRAYTVGPMTEGNFTNSAFFFGTFTYSN